MGIQKLLLLLLIWGLAFQVNAQESTSIHNINILVGLGHGQIKDKTASRLIYKGLNIPIALEYQYIKNKNQFNIGVNGYFSKPQSRFDDKALWVNYRIGIGYNRLVHINDEWQIRLGAMLPFQTTIDFFESVQAEYFYWVSTFSVNPTFRLERFLENENTLFIEANFPLLGYYSRPPIQRFTNAEDNFGYILTETNTNHQFFILPDHRQVEMTTGISYNIKEKIKQNLSYRLTFLQNPDPKLLSLIIHQIHLQTTLNWEK